MIKIIVNDESVEIEEKSTIAALIEQLGIAHLAGACALNSIVVAKAKWLLTELKEGDRVEILRFVGGG